MLPHPLSPRTRTKIASATSPATATRRGNRDGADRASAAAPQPIIMIASQGTTG